MHCTPEETRTILLWGFGIGVGCFIIAIILGACLLAEWRAMRDDNKKEES